jgi:hypothetical protein
MEMDLGLASYAKTPAAASRQASLAHPAFDGLAIEAQAQTVFTSASKMHRPTKKPFVTLPMLTGSRLKPKVDTWKVDDFKTLKSFDTPQLAF